MKSWSQKNYNEFLNHLFDYQDVEKAYLSYSFLKNNLWIFLTDKGIFGGYANDFNLLIPKHPGHYFNEEKAKEYNRCMCKLSKIEWSEITNITIEEDVNKNNIQDGKQDSPFPNQAKLILNIENNQEVLSRSSALNSIWYSLSWTGSEKKFIEFLLPLPSSEDVFIEAKKILKNLKSH